jgi:hypothetical protein
MIKIFKFWVMLPILMSMVINPKGLKFPLGVFIIMEVGFIITLGCILLIKSMDRRLMLAPVSRRHGSDVESP